MTAEISVSDPLRVNLQAAHERSQMRLLRAPVMALGILWSLAFIVVGLFYELQLYGDGSIFSYAVAVQDAWAFHWHNISGRVFVYLYAFVPAEALVALTGKADDGIALYGFLHFAAPLFGLVATFFLDKSRGRIILTYACFSTACLCPLVFGFPTEMWIAHALFWPTLALCHYARAGVSSFVAIFLALLALVLSHPGAIILALAILATLALRGLRDPAWRRALSAFLAAMAVWAVVTLSIPPDDYIVDVMVRAAFNFIDIESLADGLSLLLTATLIGYGIAIAILRRVTPERAVVCAAILVAAVLAVYWRWFDHALHTQNRYYLRTALLVVMPVLGGLAAAYALAAGGRLKLRVPFLAEILELLPCSVTPRAALGGLLLITLIHAVETAKFTLAWNEYKTALRALAMGRESDLVLGDKRFVSAARLGRSLNRLAWSSTTPFLSVLVAPDFSPARLVIDPRANYFWLSCETAKASEETGNAIPAQSRELIRVHACLHR